VPYYILTLKIEMALVNILMMSTAEIFGNVHFKWFAKSQAHHHLMGGLVGYIGVMYFLVQSFTGANLLYVSAMWEGMITVLGSIVAYFLLGERFNSPVQYFGIVLGLIAMLMVHAGGVPHK
jgi:multidrug transporter EmrE-like cation transporter